eukprot:TRINITY_DN21381_c0_g2_i1.p1 TRINITY_DN21381_c0_g2~~TRINITY_DN21381_c0_g2_i1.p1  ORF type:complete len:329 (-),score=39.66 TRINITY_DN21381_c0_g2_i1:198-1184(-)
MDVGDTDTNIIIVSTSFVAPSVEQLQERHGYSLEIATRLHSALRRYATLGNLLPKLDSMIAAARFCMVAALVFTLIVLYTAMAREKASPCDVPLRMWTTVETILLFASWVYFCHCYCCALTSLHLKLLMRCARCSLHCLPLRRVSWWVVFVAVLVKLPLPVWHCVGLYWVYSAQTCAVTSPDVYTGAKYAMLFSLVAMVIQWMLAMIFVFVLTMMSWIEESTSDISAPTGTLEAQAVVEYDPEAFAENRECSICMQEFDSVTPIRRTTCGHCFHEECLKNWFKTGRTCPVCRADLSGAATAKQAAQVYGASSEASPATTTTTAELSSV